MMTCPKHEQKLTDGLHRIRLKATPARLRLLDIFEHAKQPLSAGEAAAALGASGVNSSTVYRNLESLVGSGLLKKVSLRSRQAHYELSDSFSDRCHHHYLICLSCGRVAEVTDCSVTPPGRASLVAAGFQNITDHSLEFFGFCRRCSKKAH